MAFFCFRRKLPWSKTNYNCREAEQHHVMKISKAGAVDEDEAPYGKNGVSHCNGKSLDKYGIDLALDGSLRRSKKKKKKQPNVKQKNTHTRKRESQKEDVERSRLAPMLDNATVQSPVCISVRLVHDFVSNGNEDLKVLRGETVIARYRKNENVFVQCFNGTYGFVPARFCYLLNVYQLTEFLDVNLVELVNSINDGGHAKEVSCNIEGADVDTNDNKDDNCISMELGKEDENSAATGQNENMENEFVDEIDSQQAKSQPIALQEQNESDSLARRIKKHEIRQLLKREASKKLSSDHSSIPIGPLDIQKSHDTPKEPIRNDAEFPYNLIRQNSAECSLQAKSLANGYLSPSVHSSISSLQNTSETASKRLLKTVDFNRPNEQFHVKINEHEYPDGNTKTIHSDLYDRRETNDNILENQGYFYNGQNEALFTETEINKIVDGKPRQYILSNRRCTSLRKITNVPLKPPARANSLRYPSYCYENGIDENSMVRSINGSLPRTPGRFQVQNNSRQQYDDMSDRMSINSLQSTNGSIHLNNSLQSCNGSILLNNSLQPTNGSIHSIQSGNNGMHFRSSLEATNESVVAIRNFISASRDDLSFAKGEILMVIRKDSEGWWWVRNSKGQEGFAPCNFIAPLERINGIHHGAQKLQYRPCVEDDAFSDREKPIIQPSLVSLETQRLLESRMDWQQSLGQKLYCEENGKLAIVMPNLRSKINEENEKSSIESKEELLRRIRSEIDKDPSTSFSKINTMKANFCSDYDEEINRVNNKVFYKDNKENLRSNTCRSSLKLKLPSYTEYIGKARVHNDNDDQSFYSSSFSDVSNLDGSVCGTPRALRRRKTYSGASNKKVRFSQSGHDNGATSSDVPSMQCYIENEVESTELNGSLSKIQADLSTWC